MNGPIKSENNKQESGFDWMESGIIFAGVLVVLGLLMESWPELRLAWSEGRFPKLPVTGGIIVTVGVLTEVLLGIFITQRANRVQSRANERISIAEKATAEAQERTANLQIEIADARERQAEAEQTIADLRRNQAPRWSRLDVGKFFRSLQSRTKGIAEILYEAGDSEVAIFTAVLLACLRKVGWTVAEPTSFLPRTPEQLSHTVLLFGPPSMWHQLSIIARSDAKDGPFTALLDAFNECQFSVARDVHPELPQSELPDGIVRIYIGSKPERWPMSRPRPVTPPQA